MSRLRRFCPTQACTIPAVVEAIDNAEEAETVNNDEIQANTNNSKNNKYVAAADNFNDINSSGGADDNLDEIVVELLQIMEVEENGAQVGNIDKENFLLATVVMDHEPRTTKKSTPIEKISRWHKSVNKPDDVQIDLAFLRELKLRESVPVAWCVENHEVHCLESFFPACLTKISTHLWEITDEDDLEMAQLDWGGDKGVENLMGIYIQHPLQNFINYFQTHLSAAALSSTMSQDQHEVSPCCAGLRKLAAGKLELRAKSMKVVAMKKGVGKVFEVGEVVLVPLANVDKAKIDAQNLTGVIVKFDINSLTAIDGRDRQYFNELSSTVVSRRIFIL
jgi:hypothetical protein